MSSSIQTSSPIKTQPFIEEKIDQSECKIGEEGPIKGEGELLTKRNKLTITNNTHIDEGGTGRDLRFVWSRDVHQPPQTTERLHPGNSDSRKSRGIGNGQNTRHFAVEVFRWKGSDLKKIGDFTHNIYAGALSNGVDDNTWIFKNYTADNVQLHREYYVPSDPPQKTTQFIGSIPRGEW